MGAVQDHYHDLCRQLARLRRRTALLWGLKGLSTALAAALGLGLLWLILEAAFYLPPSVRTASGLAAALLAAGAAVRSVSGMLPYLRSTYRFARLLEHTYPHLAEQVSSALTLWDNQRARQLYSADLIGATVKDAADTLKALDTRVLLDRRPLWMSLRHIAASAAVLIAALTLSPELRQAAGRCAQPRTAFERQPGTLIFVEPGDQTVVRGDDATMRLQFRGELPHTARVRHRDTPEDPWQQEEILVEGADSISFLFAGVRRPLQFQVLAGDGSSAVHRITVIDPPYVDRLRLDLDYPAYTGLAPRREDNHGDIRALPGTTVDLTIFASKSLSAAAVVVDDSIRIPAAVDGNRAWARLEIDRNAHYHIELIDELDVGNRDPIRYTIEKMEDAPPRVQVTAPGQDMDLPESMQVSLAVEATDDFGVASVELVYRIDDGPEQSESLTFVPGKEVHLTHDWDLSGKDLLPEDRIYYRVVAGDNDSVSGPKFASSREYALRFPSLYELYREATHAQDEQRRGLQELSDQGRETGEFLERVRRELVQREELSWDRKEELKATIQAELDRTHAVEELSRELERTMKKLEAEGLASQDLLDKVAELRKMMAEVLSPELRRALEELQQTLSSDDPRELAEALRQFNQDHQAFQERLEQTLAMLEQVRTEQRLEAATQKAQDLAERQGQINQELDPEADTRRLVTQEQALQRDTERLQEELRDLGQSMSSMSQEMAERLKSHAEDMESRDFSGRMQQMIEHMQAGANPEARRQGEGLEQELGELAASMQQIQQEYVSTQKQLLADELRHAMRGLLDLSRRQKALRDTVGGLAEEEASRLADHQHALAEGVAQVARSIGAVSRKTMALEHPLPVTLGYALNSMREAAVRLNLRTPGRALASQQDGMRYMNEGVMLLRQSQQNLAQSSMPSSFGEAMQKMMGLSEQQAQLNQATQQALDAAQAGSTHSDFMSAQARLSAEQQMIYQALEQLRREVRGMGGAEHRVGAIQEEMERVLGEMEHQRLSHRTLERQERILQRMLDASRSMHTQGEDEERWYSRTGEEQEYTGPAWLPADLGQSYDALRDAMRRALSAPYPDEYRPVIQRYYELMYQDAHGSTPETGE